MLKANRFLQYWHKFLVLLNFLIFTSLLLIIVMPSVVKAAIYDPSPADGYTKLVAYLGDTSENKIPLILIHGIHGNQTGSSLLFTIDDINNPNYLYWQNFLDYFYANDLHQKFKLYLFFYESDKYSVREIARSLRNKLDDAIDCEKGDSCTYGEKIKDVPFVIVAHSMGGLVARSYMQEHSHRTGFYGGINHADGKRGGERIINLITLATPHHGSPAVNNEPRFNGLVDPAWDEWSKIDDASYWGILSKCWTCVLDPDNFNRADLRYDNFDGLWDGIPNEYINDSIERNDWLRDLNNIVFYDNKIIAYYGYIGNDPEVDLYGNMDASTFHWYLYANIDFLRQNHATALRFSGVLLERIF